MEVSIKEDKENKQSGFEKNKKSSFALIQFVKDTFKNTDGYISL